MSLHIYMSVYVCILCACVCKESMRVNEYIYISCSVSTVYRQYITLKKPVVICLSQYTIYPAMKDSQALEFHFTLYFEVGLPFESVLCSNCIRKWLLFNLEVMIQYDKYSFEFLFSFFEYFTHSSTKVTGMYCGKFLLLFWINIFFYCIGSLKSCHWKYHENDTSIFSPM